MTFDGSLTPRDPVKGPTKKSCYRIFSYAIGWILMNLTQNDLLVVKFVLMTFHGGSDPQGPSKGPHPKKFVIAFPPMLLAGF